jgi:hypothetical protein
LRFWVRGKGSENNNRELRGEKEGRKWPTHTVSMAIVIKYLRDSGRVGRDLDCVSISAAGARAKEGALATHCAIL